MIDFIQYSQMIKGALWEHEVVGSNSIFMICFLTIFKILDERIYKALDNFGGYIAR
mgnify:CR=1 FL=1